MVQVPHCTQEDFLPTAPRHAYRSTPVRQIHVQSPGTMSTFPSTAFLLHFMFTLCDHDLLDQGLANGNLSAISGPQPIFVQPMS